MQGPEDENRWSDRIVWNQHPKDQSLVRFYMEDEIGRMFFLMSWILNRGNDANGDVNDAIRAYMEENVDGDWTSNPFQYVFSGLTKWVQRDFDTNENPRAAFQFLDSVPVSRFGPSYPVYGVDWIVMFLLVLRLYNKEDGHAITEGLSESELMYWIDQLNRYVRVNDGGGYKYRVVLPSCGKNSESWTGRGSWARAVNGHTRSVLTQDQLWSRVDWNNSLVVYMIEIIGSEPIGVATYAVDEFMRTTIEVLQDEDLLDDEPLDSLPGYYNYGNRDSRDAMDYFLGLVRDSKRIEDLNAKIARNAAGANAKAIRDSLAEDAKLAPAILYAYDLTVKALPAAALTTIEPYEVRLRKQAAYRAQLLANMQPRAGAGGPSPPRVVPTPDPIPDVPDVNDKRALRRAVREIRGFRGPGGKHRTRDQCYEDCGEDILPLKGDDCLKDCDQQYMSPDSFYLTWMGDEEVERARAEEELRGLYFRGYDVYGYDSQGYNRAGFNKEGYDREGYDREGYDREGFNEWGYDKRGFDRAGKHLNGWKFDREGYDSEGYDSQGFNRQGLTRNGTKYDDNGFDQDGMHKNGTEYDEEGYDYDGYNPKLRRYREDVE